MARKRLGDVLKEQKRLSQVDLEKALSEQQGGGVLLGEMLMQRGLVSKDDIVAALEEVTHFRYVDARFATVEKAMLKLVPRAAADRYGALPMVREGKKVVTVMAEPQNLRALDELRFLCGMEISPRLGFRSEIDAAIKKCYEEDSGISEGTELTSEQKKLPFVEQVDVSGMQFFTASSSERSKAAMEEFEAEMRQEKTPAVALVSALLCSAATKKASDIHIEPQALTTVVRIRVDGVLRELTNVPTELQTSLISRIKILADMDIAERRQPQDGRFLVQIGNRNLDLRVSTLPTHYGEKVVMRLLDSSATKVGLPELGLPEGIASNLETILKLPQGMVLVTGPTGSGKSTTLYSCLNILRAPTVNIITVEDPVEYKIEDINQVQVNSKAGLTFSTCLRSILRQDPNVIMVGEVRDAETAEIALQASQTGHLVLSSLHTNDAVAAVTRLLDLHIPGFMISSSVTAIMAQRLVRKLCSCREESPSTTEYATRLLNAGITEIEDRMFTPVGCPVCDNSGYKGRVGIYEMLVFDEQIREAVRSAVRDEEIRNLARSCGMHPMQEDAMDKVRKGFTTIEEVLRVVPFENAQSSRCRNCNRVLATSFLYCPYCGSGVRRTGAGATPPQGRRVGVGGEGS